MTVHSHLGHADVPTGIAVVAPEGCPPELLHSCCMPTLVAPVFD